MTPDQFVYWLRGRTEGRDIVPPTLAEWKIILDHLELVFNKTPQNPLTRNPLNYPPREGYKVIC